MRVLVLVIPVLCAFARVKGNSAYSEDDSYLSDDTYDSDEDGASDIIIVEEDTFDASTLLGERVAITANEKIGSLNAAMELDTRNLFDDVPSGNVPRTRVSPTYLGEISMAMGHAFYRPSAARNKYTRSLSLKRLAGYSKSTITKLWDQYEKNSGGKLKFVDAITGNSPIWRRFLTRANPKQSRTSNNRLINDLRKNYGVVTDRTARKWGVASRSAKRGNGGGGKSVGSVAVIRFPNKGSLIGHEVNHGLGLTHSKKGRLNNKGRYTDFVSYQSDFSLVNEGNNRANLEVASCVEQHYMDWNADEDYQFIEFNKTMGLRNVGREMSEGRTEPVSIVWENPYGGQHWFCYGIHGKRGSSIPIRQSFSDRSGITHEQIAPLTKKCATLQDPFYYGKYKSSAIGTTGLVMHVEEKFEKSAGVALRFEFDKTAFDMPAPLVELWTEPRRVKGETIATSLWVYFWHRDDNLRSWSSTPYVLPLHHLKLRCGTDTFAHNATTYTLAEKAEFVEFETGVYMWPRRCGRGASCTASANKMNRQVRIDIIPPLTEATNCTLLIDKHKHLYKHLTLSP
ncbi:Hypothetical Protein FCC1311_032512 [Hondaea fermentalgiana]|uniref:Uncharacterized protein n=1 Tax=Hondaea fermentalgiana TaxID=2315210 RepID=A0A2R5GBE4_9STRA|nr:Hypothetical Protein FCC1311_032512 [Hondaea fermentalgiana]|eukprot:GBG27028.1 Hypothetical Protein FCC1311_032512 [Hondaea fermentalgiana]